MTPLSIQVPFPVFQGRDGQPLENGYVWIGQANLNPQTNPVVAYFDAALTIPAPQPLRTLNGYISRAGTPAQIYVDGANFSILVQDSKGSMVYNFPLGNGIGADACGLTYNPPFTGAVPYPVCQKLAQTVSSKDFGVVGDGVTDDTVALLNAFQACRTNNQTLLLLGQIVFNLASVPSSFIVAAFAGNYVEASSMIGEQNAELLVTGKIGFMMDGVDQTVVSNIKITTFGREMNESENEFTSPYLFITTAGPKTSAIYQNLDIYHTVTNLTGAYRAGTSIFDRDCSSVLVDNVRISNSTTGIGIFASENITIRNIYLENVQTGMYFTNAVNFQIDCSTLINTESQSTKWVQRTNAVPRFQNGMDHILVEGGNHGTVIGLHSTYAIERTSYIQASNVHQSDCYTLNSDGYKFVGVSYTDQIENNYLNNCHVYLDSNLVRAYEYYNYSLASGYLGKNISISNCSIINDSSDKSLVPYAILLGFEDGSTYENVIIDNVKAINVMQLTGAFLCQKTAAELAAMTPPGSFLALRNVKILNCYVQTSNVAGVFGALFGMIYVGASNDESKFEIAAENIVIANNFVDNFDPSLGNRPFWLYDIKWVDGLDSYENRVTASFRSGGFYTSNMLVANAPVDMTVAPYDNIHIKEPYLRYSIDSGVLINQLALVSVIADSQINFTINNSEKQRQTVTAVTSDDQTFADGYLTAAFYGVGFAGLVTTRDFAIDMTASGLQYFGRVIGGVKTDQVSTPPIAITVNPGVDILIRGDIQPTVRYFCKMTLV
jgi:hypothetical protein